MASRERPRLPLGRGAERRATPPLACRPPSARDPDAFWDSVRRETEGYLRAREEELAREQERLRQQQEEREALAAQVGRGADGRGGDAGRRLR
jgi:hypothetical protein